MNRQQATVLRRWLCVLALSWAPVALSATISASVDSSSLRVDESFHLIFEADRDIEAEPDLSPLEENFEIVNQSRNQDVSITNARVTRRASWQIELLPIRAGTFTIPAIEFGSVRSNPVTVQVWPAGLRSADRPSHFFLEVEVDEDTPYVQQQVIYTVRVFRTVNAIAARLSEPALEGVDALVERLGEDSVFAANRADRRYRVTERRYAIFPQASGTLVIPPLHFQAKVIERVGFGLSTPDTVRTRIIRVRSEEMTVPVLEAPVDTPPVWVPARSLSLSESWPAAGPVSVGDTLTRRIAIRAAGLTAAQLPELTLELPEGMKQYPEQPELKNLAEGEGVTGTRVQTTALVATRPGTFTLPAVAVTWWNVETRQTEQALLPPRTIEVTDSGTVPAATAQLNPDTRPGPVEGADTTAAYWQWISGGLALAWLLTLWQWWLDRRRSAAPDLAPLRNPAPGAKQALAALKRACTDHDARAARDALLAWSAAAWPQAPPANLTQLGTRCGDGLSVAVDDLQRTLYAEQPGRWNGAQLWEQAKRIELRPPTPATANDVSLEPLYKARRDELSRV